MIYGDHMARGIAYLTMIMMLAPMIAPPIGIVLLEIHGWQLIFLMLAAYALLALIICAFSLPKVARTPLADSLWNTFFKSYGIVLGRVAVRRYIIMNGFSALAFFGYLTAIAFIYMAVYQVNEKMFGVLFSINVAVFIAASFFNARSVIKLGLLQLIKGAWLAAFIAAVGLLVVNLLSMHLYWTVIFMGLLVGSIVIVSTNVESLILIAFSKETGTATGVVGIMRFGCGALAGPILAFFYDGTALPFCYLMLFTSLGMGFCLFVMSPRTGS
jgi:DHA1 family bicyclomycin/chloramphenicol resistance-like MFS transporter